MANLTRFDHGRRVWDLLERAQILPMGHGHFGQDESGGGYLDGSKYSTPS